MSEQAKTLSAEPIYTYFFEDGTTCTIYKDCIKFETDGQCVIREPKSWHSPELAMKEAPTIGEAIMRTMLDHYWDSLEPQKDLILKHIEGAMRAISPNTPKDSKRG